MRRNDARPGRGRTHGTRRRVWIGAILAAGAVGAWWAGRPRTPDGSGRDDLVAEADPSHGAAAKPGLAASKPASADPPEVPREKAARLPLGGPWHVRVYDRVTKVPLKDEQVMAAVLLHDAKGATAVSTLTATRSEPTGDDGVAVFRKMVVGHPVRLYVGREDAPRGETTVRAVDLGPATFDLYISAPLPFEQASCRLLVGGDVDDLTPGLRLGFDGPRTNLPHLVAPGDRVFVSDDASGPDTLEAKVTVHLPTYVGDEVPVVLRRGQDQRLDVRLPPPATVEVRVLDVEGRPMAGIEVGASSAALHVGDQRDPTWRGVTDDAGVARVPAYVGHPVVVSVLGPDVVGVPARLRVAVERPRESVTRTALPLVPVDLRLLGAGADEIALDWIEAEFHPRVLAGVGGRPHAENARLSLRAACPAGAPVQAGADGTPTARLAIFPGTYAVQVRLPGAETRDVTFLVPIGATEPVVVDVGALALESARVHLLATAAASPSPFTFGLLVGHPLALADRLRLLDFLVPTVAAVRGVRGSSAALDVNVSSSRGRVPHLPADAAVVREDGRAEGLSAPRAAGSTLLLPDGGTAILPPLPRSDARFMPLPVPAASLARLLVRVVDEAGRPMERFPMRVEAVLTPSAGDARSGGFAGLDFATDRGGELGLPVLPQEAVAVLVGLGERGAAGFEVVGADGVQATRRTGPGAYHALVLHVERGPLATVTLRRVP